MLPLFIQIQCRLAMRRSSGQSLAEYGLVLTLVAVVCAASMQMLGTNISTVVNNACNTLSQAISNAVGGS